MRQLALLLLIFGCFTHCSGAGVVCRDDNGNEVDWYYAIKLPANDSNSNPEIVYGDAYMYLLSSNPTVYDWTLSSLGADSDQSMMGRTLSPIYTTPRSADLAFVLYNDENPDGNTSFTKGHSKGVLAVDQDGGFFMVQNVPKFPGWADGPYTYPSSGHMYGQGFLCITIQTDQADLIGIQFQYSQPNIFDYTMPSWSETTLPDLWDAVVNVKEVQSEPWYNILDIQSVGAVTFTVFSKHTNYGQDIYADLIAPTLQTDLYVETWNHGDDEMSNFCTPYKVQNVDEFNVSPASYSFSNYWDHSKWAVAPPDATVPWICLGDNNRMHTQEARAGLSVCQQSATAWSAFSNAVLAVEACNDTNVQALGCYDDEGNPVDWFYAYKLPQNDSRTEETIVYGDGYVYMLSTGSASSWIFSDSAAGYDDSMMGGTLAPIYDSGDENLLYVMYNEDEPDGTTSSSRGFTKGVIAFDENNGFWMIHSVPKYPNIASDYYSYPTSGYTYGHSFLCISLKTAGSDVIGTQFQYNIPNVYDSNMPSWSQTALPALYDYVVNDVQVTEAPWYHVADLQSAGGASFKSFAKHSNWGLDLYGDLVAPTLDSDLLVETWNHGTDEIPTVCANYTVKNVLQVHIADVDYSFVNSFDDSKWAVAPPGASEPWVCVGDINRMESQESRAGGIVCASSTRPWTAYSETAEVVQACP